MRASQKKAEEKESRMTEVSNGCKQGSSEMRSLLAKTQEEPQVGQGDGEWRLGSLRFKASVMQVVRCPGGGQARCRENEHRTAKAAPWRAGLFRQKPSDVHRSRHYVPIQVSPSSPGLTCREQ